MADQQKQQVQPTQKAGVAQRQDPALAHDNRQHKRFPRWLRMSTRVSLLVGVIALPSLCVKDESFKNLNKYRCVARGWG
jgi:hypothetical protein